MSIRMQCDDGQRPRHETDTDVSIYAQLEKIIACPFSPLFHSLLQPCSLQSMHRERIVLLGLLALAATTNCFVIHRSAPNILRHAPSSCRNLRSVTMQAQHESPKALSKVASQDSMAMPLGMPLATMMLLAPTAVSAAGPEWLEPTRITLDIALAIFSTLFFIRIPMTWYPQMDLNQFPQNLVAW